MKTVLITGASGNVGKATVERFTREGYSIIATVSPGKELGFEVAENVETVAADLTDEQSVNDVLATLLAKHKTIDAALMLVGGYAPGGISETDGTVMKKMLRLNFDTAFFVARPLFQHMMKQSGGGRLVFVGARPALNPKEANRSLGYALSKSLLFKLAESLTAEGSASNVTASVVVPSTIDTEVNRKAMPNADFSTWVTPEEIADTMAYLCAPESKARRGNVVKLYGRA